MSIDTVKARVAEAAIAAGASIVNDVSGFPSRRGDAADVRARRRGRRSDAFAGRRCRHGHIRPRRVRRGCHGATSSASCAPRVDAADAAGIQRERIVVDPGIGFSKRGEHSLRLLAELSRLRGSRTFRCWSACRASGSSDRSPASTSRRSRRRERSAPTSRRLMRRRDSLPRARREAGAPGARRGVGDHARARRRERSRTAATCCTPAGATCSKWRS